MWLNTETEVTQDLRTQSVAQTDVLEPDHVPLRRAAGNVHRPVSPRVNSYIATPTALESTTFGQRDRLAPAPFAGATSWVALGFAFGFPLGSPLGFRSVNERPASVQRSPGLARFADADHLHELWNL